MNFEYPIVIFFGWLILPESGAILPVIISNNVVLPAPFGPIRAILSLIPTINVTSLKRMLYPNLFDIFTTLNIFKPGSIVASAKICSYNIVYLIDHFPSQLYDPAIQFGLKIKLSETNDRKYFNGLNTRYEYN